jgi:hypothetical protein
VGNIGPSHGHHFKKVDVSNHEALILGNCNSMEARDEDFCRKGVAVKVGSSSSPEKRRSDSHTSSEQQEPYNDIAQETEQPSDVSTIENADGRARRYVRVNVTRSRTFGPTKFVFEDNGKRKRSTLKNDWKQIQYNGEWVWAFQSRKTVYFSTSRALG